MVLCEGGDGGRGGVGASLPVIVFVMTKMLSLPGKPALKVSACVGKRTWTPLITGLPKNRTLAQ